MTNKIGILLTNTGTPDAPTPQAVRSYLREFLSDPRIVQIPRLIWLPILYGLILTTRPKKSAALYKKIWGKTDSPLRENMLSIREKLSHALAMPVEIGMNYGNPSIQTGIAKLHEQQADEIIVLPLFPQYSHSTTASSFDRSQGVARKIESYANHSHYIEALAHSVQQNWEKVGRGQHLLISFHGIPQTFVKNGDPYPVQCASTANLLAEALHLSSDQWTLCYQSQFGYAKWLQPATFDLLAQLPQKGLTNIDIICPGFAVDRLETLEEIAIRGHEVFTEAGGKTLRYIPALNDSPEQIQLLRELILQS